MSDMPNGLLEDAGERLAEAVALRRRIHRHPELGLHLPATQQAVLDALDGLPLSITPGRGVSSVVAVLDGDLPGPTVLLRADMDALPIQEETGLEFASVVDGAMHACGHDAHVAMLAGAAAVLARRRAAVRGRVVFAFQPGEEGHGGAQVMLDEDLLNTAAEGAEPVSLAFALHQAPVMRAGTVATRAGALMAAVDEFRITVRGLGGHASMPHQARDPIPALAALVTALQTMVTRRIDVFDPAVITVGRLSAGTAGTVIPETATAWGTIRTVSAQTRDTVGRAVLTVAEGVAAAHGVTVEVDITRGSPVTVNGAAATHHVLGTVAALLGPERVVTMPHPVMGGEDWGLILDRVEGAMAFLGTRPAGVSGAEAAPNHSGRMVLDEGAMAAGIAVHTAVALGWQGAIDRYGNP
ncbi:M20 metallopeptidase family protein [Rhizohabitans arisaemae]|uniref:M20 metallopeptidase family protein n=1 Tax=Rhizohabitans arisaemae TaxID=2720610 RepID=UPI0024B21C8C|nr:M20 family metallopeptidase [Rhizohabitans arisaemae]